MIEDYRMAHQHALSGPLMCVLGSEVRPHPSACSAVTSSGNPALEPVPRFRLEMLSVRCLRECSGCAVDGRSLG